MKAKWNSEKKMYDLNMTAHELGLIVFSLAVSNFNSKDMDLSNLQNELLDLNDAASTESATEVIANPYATHDML